MTALAAPSVDLPLVVAEVEVRDVIRLSPSFVRIRLGGPAVNDIGVLDSPLYDQRFKMVVPNERGAVFDLSQVTQRWYDSWRRVPAEDRGYMRTYTIRGLEGPGDGRVLVVDIVVHPDVPDSGPGAAWAAAARTGDRVVVVAPRLGHPFGGIEFAPTPGDQLLMVADETALPAVASILEDLPGDAFGAVYVEVPFDGDVQELDKPENIDVLWLPRDGFAVGVKAHEAVAEHLHVEACWRSDSREPVGPDLWETAAYSSSGADLSSPGDLDATGDFGRYAWVAGEAGLVKSIRRLLKNRAWPRGNAAFMGYWRLGIAMKS